VLIACLFHHQTIRFTMANTTIAILILIAYRCNQLQMVKITLAILILIVHPNHQEIIIIVDMGTEDFLCWMKTMESIQDLLTLRTSTIVTQTIYPLSDIRYHRPRCIRNHVKLSTFILPKRQLISKFSPISSTRLQLSDTIAHGVSPIT
jgi:hypothetical protein